jgi:hypothetical protein
MYLQKVISRKLFKKLVFLGVLKVNDDKKQDPDPDLLVRGMDLQVRIHTKNVMDPQHCRQDTLCCHRAHQQV